ncbi:FxsA family protein [Gilvimarinus sp. F26214L]|uniref:FxsA family protein n=1 Tax=Gilvimarinus sp. DZF01 TaxID=3461371 RepID=UPI004045D687
MPVFLVLFVLLPVLELWLLIQVGTWIGALPTIALVFLTAVVGLALLRKQSLSTLMRANERMQRGEVPATEMGEGLFLAAGGALLLTPGFITDVVGLACLVPGPRRWLLGRILRHVQVVRFGGPAGPFGPRNPQQGRQPPDRHTIEGEYRRDD